tara:strand:- start:4797 stop:5120 length:324 start_codon:yes stop_codon:yes gene_type:complete
MADQEMTRLALAASAAIMAVFLCVPAAAQNVCGPYSAMTARLMEKHSEVILGRGIDAAGRMLEIWGGDDGWTILLVRPEDMMSCLMLIGQKGTQWQAVEPKPVGPKS